MPQFLDRDNPTLSVLQRVRLTRCRMRSEFVGWLVKVLRERRHDPGARFFGTMGGITALAPRQRLPPNRDNTDWVNECTRGFAKYPLSSLPWVSGRRRAQKTFPVC